MTKEAVLTVSGKWKSQLENEVTARDHEFIVDEPQTLDGADAGASPKEYFLGALSASISIMTAKIASEQGFHYSGLTFSASGTLDPRTYLGTDDVQSYFHTVDIQIDIETAEEPEAVTLLRETVEKRCPLYNLLIDAGVKVNMNWMMKMPQEN